jgi:tRNA dimethylallyltransferase
MDVGTGKLPAHKEVSYEKFDSYWLLEGVKVWGYDLVEPDEYFSAYDFAEFGLKKARELLEKKLLPVIAGGTGLYIYFLSGRISDLSGPPDLELRKELESKGLKELQEEVTSLNIELNRSDFHNKYRLVRVLERERTTKSPSPLPYLKDAKYVFLGLTAPRDFLYSRVDSWADSIWQDDLIVKEVKDLINRGYENSSKLQGLVYKNAYEYLKKEKSRRKAIQRTKFNLHAYIRRQQTYFKRNKKIKWFDITQDNYIQNLYNYFKDV